MLTLENCWLHINNTHCQRNPSMSDVSDKQSNKGKENQVLKEEENVRMWS